MGRNRIIVIKVKMDNSPIDISSLKGIEMNEEIKNGSGRRIVKIERRTTAVFSFSPIEVITPYMKKRNNAIPIRVLSVITISIHNV